MGRGALLSLAIAALLLATPFLAMPASAPPPLPMRTHGVALDRGGAPLPPGTPIRTFVDGVDYSDGASVQGPSGAYSVLTAGNWVTEGGASETPSIQEGAKLDDPVIYAAGDFIGPTDVFREALPWAPGAVVNQDLTVGSLTTTPLPLKIQGIVARPAQGGNQYVFLCNPETGPVSLADYYLELNRPGVYRGPRLDLTGVLGGLGTVRVALPSSDFLTPTGDALKLVYRNPGGASASAAGRDVVVDRVEFNATRGGTLSWEPGNTIMGDAPAPGVGRILERSPTCFDTNKPSDFRLVIEPGLPDNGPPTVRVLAPAPGEEVVAGVPVEISWSMSDDLFRTVDLAVWINVTVAGSTVPLLTEAYGATSVLWTPPDVAGSATVRVDVVDPFGERATDSATFRILRQTPFALLIAALVVLVLVGFVVLAFVRSRRRQPPAAPPTSLGAPPAVPAHGPPAGKKVCPNCGTAVMLGDLVCFYCGHRFPTPPEGRP